MMHSANFHNHEEQNRSVENDEQLVYHDNWRDFLALLKTEQPPIIMFHKRDLMVIWSNFCFADSQCKIHRTLVDSSKPDAFESLHDILDSTAIIYAAGVITGISDGGLKFTFTPKNSISDHEKFAEYTIEAWAGVVKQLPQDSLDIQVTEMFGTRYACAISGSAQYLLPVSLRSKSIEKLDQCLGQLKQARYIELGWLHNVIE
jgi:hypothetical protein